MKVLYNGNFILSDREYNDIDKIIRQSITEVEIIPGTTVINEEAFADCISLEKVTIPDSVTTIGTSAFARCKSLKKINLPDTLIRIGDNAFGNCYNLESIDLPNSLEKIEGRAFFCCFKLSNIKIPPKVKTISQFAFCDCKNLTNVELPENIEIIERMAFADCKKLHYINIPENIQYIDPSSFKYSESLEKSIYNNIYFKSIYFNNDLEYLIDNLKIDTNNSELMQEIMSVNPMFYDVASEYDKEVFIDAILDDIENIYYEDNYYILKSPLCDIIAEKDPTKQNKYTLCLNINKTLINDENTINKIEKAFCDFIKDNEIKKYESNLENDCENIL